jgi:acyl carrier protein
VRGEIYIGGIGLGRGYFKSPELTVKNFIAHPFSSDPQARLYKTGDMARYRADGNIEFLGCADNQAKIRGFRVELGEIEGTLVQHPSVRDAVVLARDDTSGRRRLVAYVTSNQGAGPTNGELASFLRAALPDYMVPSAFVFVNHFPATANGKVDRKALAALSQDNRELGDSFVAPRTANEKTIASIWADVLNLKQIGIYDDFFDLGNHSTLAIELIDRIRETFAIDLSLRALFEVPTVAGMATAVGQRKNQWPMEHGNGRSS